MEHAQSRRKRPVTVAAILLIAVSMVMAIMTVVAPSASAHSGKFEHDDQRFAETGCEEGTVPNGATSERFGRQVIGCTPESGYTPIGNNQALCDEIGRSASMIEGHCAFDRALPCGTNPAFIFPISNGMCLRLALVLNEFAPAGAAARALTPACVNSGLVQEEAAAESVGAVFSVGATSYVITTGASCGFNCLDGWDLNCDGKLGDFCASEYDLSKVSNVDNCTPAPEPAAVS